MEEFISRAQPWAMTVVAHNWPVLVFALLVPWAAVHAYLRPSRRALLLLYGLLLLALAFEYQKHGALVLMETARYLFSEETNPGPRYLSQIILADVAPAIAYLLGLAAIVASLISLRRRWPMS